jgi:hypothetical protein
MDYFYIPGSPFKAGDDKMNNLSLGKAEYPTLFLVFIRMHKGYGWPHTFVC